MLSPAGAISESSKGHSIILLGQLFQDEGKPNETSEFYEYDSMLYFICCKMSFFVRNDVIWNIMRVSKAYCKPTDGGFSRNIECRKGKTISSINVFSSENKESLQ